MAAQPNMANLVAGFNMASTELERFQNLPAMVPNLQLQHILEQIQNLYDRMNERFDEAGVRSDDMQHRFQLLQARMDERFDATDVRIDERFAAADLRFDDTEQRLQMLQDAMAQQPMRSYNLTVGKGVLRGPNGFIPAPHPNTVNALSVASERRCKGLAAYLELPQLPGEPTVEVQREQIANYLGIVF